MTAAVQQTVTEQVTESVRHKVLEQVVPAVTSGQLDAAGYEAALAAGTLEKGVQTAVEQAGGTADEQRRNPRHHYQHHRSPRCKVTASRIPFRIRPMPR